MVAPFFVEILVAVVIGATAISEENVDRETQAPDGDHEGDK